MHSDSTTRLSRTSVILLGVAVTLVIVVFTLFNRSTTTDLPSGDFETSVAMDSVSREPLGDKENVYPDAPSIAPPSNTVSKKKEKQEEVIEHEIVIEDPTANLPSPPPVRAAPLDPVHTIVDENATPHDGMPEFYNYIKRKMKYPALAARTGVEGRVFVEFIVEKNGTLTEVKSVKGIGAGCDEEAVRLISSSPPWKPAMLNGEVVRQKIILHVRFELDKKQRRRD